MGARYAPEVKNHARARWKAGDSLTEIAADIGAPKNTVWGWIEHIPRGIDAGQTVQLAREAEPEGEPSNREQASPEPVEWVDIDRVANGLIYGYSQALASVARLVGTGEGSDWIKNQSARDLAYLTDRFSDKLLRLLAAVRVVGQADSDGDTA